MSTVVEDGQTMVSVQLSAASQQQVSVDLEIRGAGGGLAGGDWQYASQSVHFVAGTTYIQFPVYPIDDAEVEWVEDFLFKLANPVGATLGYPSEAEASIADNDLAPATLTTEWLTPEEIETWEAVPANEVLWADEDHHWLSTFNPPPGVIVDNIQWFARPWSEWEANPNYNLATFEDPSEWGAAFATATGPFTSETGIAAAGGGILGELAIGVWAVTARVNFHGGFLLAQVPAEKQTNTIEWTVWEPGSAEQQFLFDPALGQLKVFPEKNDPSGPVHDEVKIKVQLANPVAAGLSWPVRIRTWDPDHEHEDHHALDTFDPNDIYHADGTVTPKEFDNRRSTPDAENPTPPYGIGAALSPSFRDVTFVGGTPTAQTVTATFTINHPQPGNNFVAAVGHGDHFVQHAKLSETDAVTPVLRTGGIDVPIPGGARTDVLTVWRTLWVEVDSMAAPNLMTDGPFDQPPVLVNGVLQEHPEYDKSIGDVPSPPTDLLAADYARANIDVKIVDPSIDVTDDAPFMHYLDFDPLTGMPIAIGRAASMADFSIYNENSFWVGQLVGAYEFTNATDFDPNGEDGTFGVSEPDTNLSFVFFETTRDYVFYYDSNPVPPNTPGEATFNSRTSLHETGHWFGLPDYTLPGEPRGIMNYFDADFGPPESAHFNNSDLGRIQAQPKPNVD